MKKLKKYIFALQLLQIKVFGKSKFWGKSSKISKDYLGRGDTVSNYRRYLGGGREGDLKTRDTACHPPEKNSERAPRASWVLVILQFGFKVDFCTGALHSSKENLPSTVAKMVYLAYFDSGGSSCVDNLKT